MPPKPVTTHARTFNERVDIARPNGARKAGMHARTCMHIHAHAHVCIRMYTYVCPYERRQLESHDNLPRRSHIIEPPFTRAAWHGLWAVLRTLCLVPPRGRM